MRHANILRPSERYTTRPEHPAYRKCWDATRSVIVKSEGKEVHVTNAVAVGRRVLLTHAHQHLPDMLGMLVSDSPTGKAPGGLEIIKAERLHPSIDIAILTVGEDLLGQTVPVASDHSFTLGKLFLCGVGGTNGLCELREEGQFIGSGSPAKSWATVEEWEYLPVEAIRNGEAPAPEGSCDIQARFTFGADGDGGAPGYGDSGGGIFLIVPGKEPLLIGILNRLGAKIVGRWDYIGSTAHQFWTQIYGTAVGSALAIPPAVPVPAPAPAPAPQPIQEVTPIAPRPSPPSAPSAPSAVQIIPAPGSLEPEDYLADALYLLQLCQQDLNMGRRATIAGRVRAAAQACAGLQALFPI